MNVASFQLPSAPVRAASAGRGIHTTTTPAGFTTPAATGNTYSGDSTVPVTRSRWRRPAITTSRRSSGARWCAVAKLSSTTTSSARVGSGPRPRRSTSPRSEPSSGNDRAVPVAGRACPGIHAASGSTSRGVTVATPGIVASRAATASGARSTWTNRSGKSWAA